MKPQVATTVGDLIDSGFFDFKIQLPMSPIKYNLNGNMKYYIALLNHNLYESDSSSESWIFNSNDENVNYDFTAIKGGVSFPNGWNDGTTIITTSVAHDTTYYKLYLSNTFRLGAISSGIQYTMPQSPDLDVNMEIEFDGVKTITTSGGGSISNVKYSGNPLWVNGDYRTNPFDVIYGDVSDVKTTGARRNGRKIWSIKFTYMSDTDLFSSNQGSTKWTDLSPSDLSGSDLDGDNLLYYDIETDDSFYAQVWNKTLGGALPFIFQPNSNDGDDFYMCKFDQKSLKVSQSAYKVYDISLKIEEVW